MRDQSIRFTKKVAYLDAAAHVVLRRGHWDGLPGNINAKTFTLSCNVGEMGQNVVAGLVAAGKAQKSQTPDNIP